VRFVEQGAEGQRSFFSQNSHGVEHALVFCHDVAHPAVRDVIEQFVRAIQVAHAHISQR